MVMPNLYRALVGRTDFLHRVRGKHLEGKSRKRKTMYGDRTILYCIYTEKIKINIIYYFKSIYYYIPSFYFIIYLNQISMRNV